MKKIGNAASAININSPIPTNLAGECKKAAKILNSFVDPGQGLDKVIPPNILEKAHGLAIFTVLKAGFLFSGRAGSGLVVSRLPDNTWSAPCAIGTGGMGAGGQIGAELTDFVLVLNTKDAVKTFSQFGNVSLGGNVSVAAGPIGRNAEASGSASLKCVSAVYSYSKTKGFFAGVSLEGSVILTRGDANEKFYGRKVSSKELLDGTVPPPQEADALYRALNARFHTLGNTGAMYNRGSTDGAGSNGSPGSFSRSPTYKGSAGISAPGSLRQPPGSTRAPPSNFHTQPAPPSYTQSAHAYGDQAQSYGGQPQGYGGQPQGYGGQTQGFTGKPQGYGGQPTPLSAVGTVRKPPPPPPSRRPQEPTARALYDFDGEQGGDLNFREGDIVTIVQKSDSQDDWWTGKIGNRQGIFPANYVQLQ